MKKTGVLLVLLALVLALPLGTGIKPVEAAYPSFTIDEVVKGVSVTLLTKDFPANVEFVARMGEYNTKAIGGIEISKFTSGEGGSFKVTLQIPGALKERAMISVRLDSTSGGYYYYNWFWNDPVNGTWPDTKPAPQPVPAPIIPTFSIKAVDPGKTVTIVTSNFPKGVDFVAKMGKMWTRGINGTEVGKLNSGEGGSFEATFDIPADLKDYQQVAIRLDGAGGNYAYNWFWNVADGVIVTPEPPAPSPAPVVYPSFTIAAVERDKTVTVKGINFPKDTDFKVLMGKMWTMGISGIEVATFNSGEGGSFTATFNIPAELAGLNQISIRLQSATVYAYNWFWNFNASE